MNYSFIYSVIVKYPFACSLLHIFIIQIVIVVLIFDVPRRSLRVVDWVLLLFFYDSEVRGLPLLCLSGCYSRRSEDVLTSTHMLLVWRYLRVDVPVVRISGLLFLILQLGQLGAGAPHFYEGRSSGLDLISWGRALWLRRPRWRLPDLRHWIQLLTADIAFLQIRFYVATGSLPWR